MYWMNKKWHEFTTDKRVMSQGNECMIILLQTFFRAGSTQAPEKRYRGMYGSRATSSWMRFSMYVSFAGPTTPSVGDHCTPWAAQRHFYDIGAG